MLVDLQLTVHAEDTSALEDHDLDHFCVPGHACLQSADHVRGVAQRSSWDEVTTGGAIVIDALSLLFFFSCGWLSAVR